MEIKKGIIIYVNQGKGYGFIGYKDDEAEKEMFFHVSGLISPELKDLKDGNEVEFIITEDNRGRARAIGVAVI